jgi:hypothetical protein
MFSSYPNAPRRNVLLLGTKAFDNLVKSIKIRIGRHGVMAEHYNRQIEQLQKREAGKGKDDVEKATKEWKNIQNSLDQMNKAMEALGEFYE